MKTIKTKLTFNINNSRREPQFNIVDKLAYLYNSHFNSKYDLLIYDNQKEKVIHTNYTINGYLNLIQETLFCLSRYNFDMIEISFEESLEEWEIKV